MNTHMERYLSAANELPDAVSSLIGTNAPVNISSVERWCSIGAGSILALGGLRVGRGTGLLLSGAGLALLYRGITGHCHINSLLGRNTADAWQGIGVPAQQGLKVETSIVVDRDPAAVFEFWRDVENLPTVMRHLKSVESLDDRRSHWIAQGPMGIAVEWDAEIFNERRNEMIAWRSFPGGDLETAGSVHFEPNEGGTLVHVSVKYNPPAGKAGEYLASALGSGFEQQMHDDLRRLKDALEEARSSTQQRRRDRQLAAR